MEIRDHRILSPSLTTGKKKKSDRSGHSLLAKDSFQPTQTVSHLPDISGLAKFSRTRSIAVTDAKLESDDKRLLLLHNKTGEKQELDVDWSKTGRPRDLEAITQAPGRGSYLAVEASSFGEHKARLFDLKVTADGAESRRSIVLPEFGQEIEGLVSIPQKDGSQQVIFGGRGDENGVGRLYWGTLTDEGLKFSEDGLKGKPVQGPGIGRAISDLELNKKGELWATAAMDGGDQGPFLSAVNKVGDVTSNSSAPIAILNDHSGAQVVGTKAEGLTFESDGKFLVASDNESMGGRFESFRIAR